MRRELLGIALALTLVAIMIPAMSVKATIVPPFTYPIAYVRWTGYYTMTDDLTALASKYGLTYAQLVDEYTEANINDLWTNLAKYKCILVDEDAIRQDSYWGSPEIRDSFSSHKTELLAWVRAGHGIWFGDENNLWSTMAWDWLPAPLDQVTSNAGAWSDPYTGCIIQDPTYRLWTFPNTIDQAWLNSKFKDCHGAFYEDSFPTGVPTVVLIRAPTSQSWINKVDGDVKEVLFWLGGGVVCLSHMELEVAHVPEYVENEICFLERPPAFSVDIKPGSWPNPIKVVSKGVFAVAICGTADFDVMTIDPTTVRIWYGTTYVAPIRWSYEDVATPYIGPIGGGHALGGDGYLDLVPIFDTQTVVTTFGLAGHVGETIPLIIRGNLYAAAGGTLMQGTDYVWLLN